MIWIQLLFPVNLSCYDNDDIKSCVLITVNSHFGHDAVKEIICLFLVFLKETLKKGNCKVSFTAKEFF